MTVRPSPMIRHGAAASDAGARLLAEEAAVALVHDGATTAVMMATPADIEDFAVGFSLTEGMVERVDEIRDLEVIRHPDGIEARLWLVPGKAAAAAARRRAIVGPSGCGLCGVDSLAAAVKPARQVAAGGSATVAEIHAALAATSAGQALGAATRATHAAGFWHRDHGLVAVREDVGRHNALDKLVGFLGRSGRSAAGGIVVITSRVSIEMVQKTAVLGAPILVAVSAPTTLAVDTADAAGITLVAVARDDGFEVFTHGERIRG